jgi:uncharacterized Zn ribbon protein
MSIQKYTNFQGINNNTENIGKFLEDKDLFIVSNNQIEVSEFGNTPYDVMEVSVYDVNNNLLPQKSGNNVAYIKSTDIKNYMYNITNNLGKKEVAIDVEKLLSDLGFTNGILKINLNFVRNRVGNENEIQRVWIQEISPSREEIRILPLKTNNENINKLNINQFKNLKSLTKDFAFYKKGILDTINSFDNSFLSKIDDYLISQYGSDYIKILKKDFGINDFEGYKKRIMENFKDSVRYFLTNKEYKIGNSNFGNSSNIRFYDYEQYEYQYLVNEINNILRDCIKYNSSIFKRRDIIVK